jgi:hypothetical protein
MKQVEDEYFKITEINQHHNTPHELVPPTPLKGLPFSTTAGGLNSNRLLNETPELPQTFSTRTTTVLFSPDTAESPRADSTRVTG